MGGGEKSEVSTNVGGSGPQTPAEGMPEMTIYVNGDKRTVPPGMTVADLLAALELEGDRIAVELDRKIVPRARWGGTRLPPGGALEVVQFVGGG